MSFLNVKVLWELFHIDIEILQMIFSMHVASSTVTGCIVVSLIHGTCNSVISPEGLSPEWMKSPVNKTLQADRWISDFIPRKCKILEFRQNVWCV